MSTTNEQANDTTSGIEQAILGCILIDPFCLGEIAPLLRPAFFDGMHEDIARVMLDLYAQGAPVDLITVPTELQRRGQLDPDRAALITQLVNIPPPGANATYYARMLAEAAQKRDRERAGVAFAQNIAKLPYAEARALFDARMAEIDTYLPQKKASRFTSVFAAISAPDPEWNIYRVFQEETVALLYAGTGSGKTFNALDMALLTALGMTRGAQEWHGRRVEPGHIIYVAGEGVGGLKGPSGRIQQWLTLNQVQWEEVEPYFHLLEEPIALMDGASIASFLENDIRPIIPADEPLRFVFFDTLATCMAGGEDISNDDANTVVRHCRRLTAATRACVVLIHHTNRVGTIRGASSWEQAVDTVFEQMRTENADEVELKNSKQRNAETLPTMHFDFKNVPLTDCLNTRQFVMTSGKPQKASKLVGNALTMLLALIKRFGATAGATYAEWAAICGVPEGSRARTIKQLEKEGYVLHEGQYYCPTQAARDYYHNYHDSDSIVTDSGDSRGKSTIITITPLRGDSDDSNFSPRPIAKTDSNQGVYKPDAEMSAHTASQSGEHAFLAPSPAADVAPSFADGPHPEPAPGQPVPDVSAPPMFHAPPGMRPPRNDYERRIYDKMAGGLGYIEAVKAVDEENRQQTERQAKGGAA